MMGSFNSKYRARISRLRWILLSLALTGTATAAQPPLVEVKSYATHMGKYIVYHYRVTNNGTRPMFNVAIGYRFDDAERRRTKDPRTNIIDEPQLYVAPEGWNPVKQETLPHVFTAPSGWTGYLVTPEGEGRGGHIIIFSLRPTIPRRASCRAKP